MQLMTRRHLCKKIGCSRQTTYRLQEEGKLPMHFTLHEGGQGYFVEDEVDKFLRTAIKRSFD